jgi:hypothetical protein
LRHFFVHLILLEFHHPNIMCWVLEIMKPPTVQHFWVSCYFFTLGPKCLFTVLKS